MNPPLAIVLKVLSALVFTVMSASIKYVSDRIPVGEIVFFRSFFMLLPLLVWLAWQGQVMAALRTRNVMGHFRRGIMSSSSMFLNFLALSYLPLTDVVALGYTAPLIVVVLAAVVLRENVQAYRWIGTGIGFAGVIVMLAPHLGGGTLLAGGAASVGVMIALAGAILTAGALIQVRRLVDTETTGAIIFYMSVMTSALGFVTILGGWVVPTAEEMAVLIAIGIVGGVGQILLTMSFRYGDASLLAPFDYTTMLWACLFGWLIFSDWPLPAVFVGAAIVIASGLFIVWRERVETQRHALAHSTLTYTALTHTPSADEHQVAPIAVAVNPTTPPRAV
ncbi:DMT family transporter [Pseudochelatococcus lubricantis]|uniref:DMT family transporter n=1 Tax=Pseudochelatococcus lubricantis TaxID=1538102 RepID=UPI0035EA275D